IHHRPHHVFRGIDHLEHVETSAHTETLGHRRESFATGVAGPGPEASRRAIDLHRAGANGAERIGEREREIFVTVEADLRVAPHGGDYRGHAIGRLLEYQRTGRVDDVDTLATGVRHDARLLSQLLGRYRVRHHQKAHRFEPDLTSEAEVLIGDVSLGA